MAETHSLNLDINAGGARKGAADFDSAIRRIDRAVQNLDKNTSAVFARVNQNVGRLNFRGLASDIARINSLRISPALSNNLKAISDILSGMRGVPANVAPGLRALASALNGFGSINVNAFRALASEISKFNSIRISAALVNNLRSLSSVMAGMRAPSGNVAFSLRALAAALNAISMTAGNVRQINALATALASIKAPPRGAVSAINMLAGSLRNLRAPSNTAAIVSALTQITNAANSTYTALSRLSTLNVNVRNPRVTGGGLRTPGAINPATGRAYGGVRPGYGFGPGRSAASGLRGFENVSNLSYQAGSAVRTAVGALTAGQLLGQITSVTREADSFRSTLASVGVSSEETRALQDRLAQSALRLGLDYMSTSQNLRSFVAGAVATGVSVSDASSMFDNFAVSMRASGLGATQAEGALRAMTQMFGKGRITAEEFRGQMAEHWSAFGPLFARFVYPEIENADARMRQLTEDMEKRGFSPRILIEFSRYMRQNMQSVAETQSRTLDAAINRTRSAWALLMKTLGEGDAGKALAETFNRFAQILQDPAFIQFMQQVGVGLANVLRSIGDMAEFAARNIDLVKYALTALLAIGAGNFFIGIARAAANVVTPFVAVARWLNLIGGGTQTATTAFTRLGAAIGSRLTGAFGLLARALAPIMGFFLTNPFGLAIAGAATLAGGIYVLYQNFDKVREVVDTVFANLDAIFGTAFDAVSSAGLAFYENVLTPIGRAFSSLADIVVDVGRSIVNAFSTENPNGFMRAIIGVVNWIKELIDLIPSLPQGGPAADSPAARTRAAGGRGLIGANAPNGANRIEGFNNGEELTPNPAAVRRDVSLERYAQQRRERRDLETNAEGGRRLGQHAAQGAVRTRNGTEQFGPDAPVRPLTRGQREDYLGGGRGGGRGEGQLRERLENFIGRLDPSFGVIERMQDGLQMLQQARQRNMISAQRHTELEGMLRESLTDQLGALDPVTKATRQYEQAMRALDGIQQAMPGRENEIAAARERIRLNLEEQMDPVGTYIRQLGEQTTLLQTSNANYEVEADLLRQRNQLMRQGVNVTQEQADAMREAIRQQRAAQQSYKDNQEGLASWANSFRDFGTELAKLEEKHLNGLADALTDFVMTGKANWRDLSNSIVRDINQLIIKGGIRELMKALGLIEGDSQQGFSNVGNGIMGKIFGTSRGGTGGGSSGGGGNSAGMIGSIVSGIGSLFGFGGGSGPSVSAPSIAGMSTQDAFNSLPSGPTAATTGIGGASAGGGGIWSAIGSAFNWLVGLFSEGGYSGNPVTSMAMPASAFVNAPRYAQGTPNTSGGMPALLHPNEAVIPLSRGRKIPVDIGNGGGGQRPVVMNVYTPDANSFGLNQRQISRRVGKTMQKSARGS